MFKVEIRKTCKVCGKPVPFGFRTYCSPKCRNKAINKRWTAYRTELNRKKQQKKAEKSSPHKIQCLHCGRYYVQIGSHVVQAHGFRTAREYREMYDLEVKRGTVPKWYRKLKGDIAIANGTYKNLKVGKKYWFKKGSNAGTYKRSHITIERLKNNWI